MRRRIGRIERYPPREMHFRFRIAPELRERHASPEMDAPMIGRQRKRAVAAGESLRKTIELDQRCSPIEQCAEVIRLQAESSLGARQCFSVAANHQRRPAHRAMQCSVLRREVRGPLI